MTTSRTLLWCFVGLLFLVERRYGFSFDVPARGEECFYDHLETGQPVNVMFQVIKGGFLDIDVVVSLALHFM